MLDAAKAMKLSAKDLLELEIIDEIVSEPIGGAHRDRELMLKNIRASLSKNFEKFKDMSSDEIFNDRKNKFLKIGRNKGFIDNLEDLSSLKPINNNLDQIFKSKKAVLLTVIVLIAVILLAIFL